MTDFRKILQKRRACVAQLVEHVLGKDGVIGSNPIVGSVFDLTKNMRGRNGKGKV